MKIGLISDTHGNVAGWDRAMEVALSGSDLIVHCGGVLPHGPKFELTAAFDLRENLRDFIHCLSLCSICNVSVRELKIQVWTNPQWRPEEAN